MGLLIHHCDFHHVKLVRVFIDVSLEFYVMTFMALHVLRILQRPLLTAFVGRKRFSVVADFSRNGS